MKAQQRIRILYAEHDEDTCLMTRILLGYSGIDVESAHTIESAVRKAKSGEFQAYLLESRFRDGSGLLLCRRLLEINPHVPVVFYSGEGRLGGENRIGGERRSLPGQTGHRYDRPDHTRACNSLEKLQPRARDVCQSLNPFI
jgi:CheY-like chemotaxis protein